MAQSTAHLFAFADKRTHGVEDFFCFFLESTVNQRQGGTTAVTSCLKVDFKIEIIELHQDETLP